MVCKHQLSHVSDYFRALFLANKSSPIPGAYHNSCNEFAVVVSSFKHPPPAVQFKWFLESVIQGPAFGDITGTCLFLSYSYLFFFSYLLLYLFLFYKNVYYHTHTHSFVFLINKQAN